MGYRAVALSQVDGAGGESIGPEVAKRLGFGYLNDAIVSQVADEYGTDAAAVAQAERRKTFFERVALAAARGGVENVAPAPAYLDDSSTVLALIRDVVVDAAARGDVVLGAHAACYACADQLDVLRVSITAPMPSRVARVAAAKGISDKDAAADLKRSDAGRANYLKTVYGVRDEASDHYDVVVNTDRVSAAATIDLIVGLVQS
jgi:cytidylate kinase